MPFIDSITVRIINDGLILYGRGNRLILQTGKNQNVNKLRPFDKIHRISTKQNDAAIQIACAAGREVLFGSIVDNNFKDCFLANFNDWISSVKVMNNGNVAILTAHGFLGLVEIVENSQARILRKLQCGENSTLYCSLIYGDSWESLTIFGGTALGELVIWRADDGRILNRQFLHNGVIFCIDYDGVHLITSSDDRSIKFFTTNENFQIDEKKQLFGHTSRIFACKIINYGGKLAFLSAGEDANLCLWCHTGDLIAKKNVSSSGMLWSIDYNHKSEVVITSSSTGKLNRFSLKEINSEIHKIELISTIQGRSIPSKIKFLSNGTLVVLDNDMKIHNKSKSGQWESIEAENRMKIVAMDSHAEKVFILSIDSLAIFEFDEQKGQLKHYKTLEMRQMLSENLKLNFLRSIHAMNDDEICVCDASGLFIVLSLPDGGRITQTFQIPKCFEPWSKAVAKVGECWLIGDRIGNLHLFNASDAHAVLPTFKLSKLHGNIGVSSIRVLDDDFIETTGIDGSIRTIRVHHGDSTLEIYATERTSINGIEKIVRWRNKEYVIGFNDDFFVVYDRKSRQIVYERRCGGRHRCWDVSDPNENGIVRFAFINRKKLNVVEFPLIDTSFGDESSWHILDCNVIDKIDNILVTGSEDTMLKVFKLESDSEQIEEITTIYSHISSIKALKLVKCDNDILIISAGGRAQISINRLINSRYIKEEVNFKLSASNGRVKHSSFDPETRFTCIFYDEIACRLLVGCSDGFIRVFEYKSEFQLNLEHFYGRCILRIHVLDIFILSMATDGLICFWRYDETDKKLILAEKIKHNQSGINSFDIAKLNDNEYKIATGGDDNEIFITTFKIINGVVELGETISSNSIHIAQITGLKFTAANLLYTVSIDQTLCKLKIINSTIELVERQFTCVSDVKGMLQLKNGKFMIYGAGVEIVQ